MILALPDQQFFVRQFNNNQRLTRKGFYAGNSRTEEMTKITLIFGPCTLGSGRVFCFADWDHAP